MFPTVLLNNPLIEKYNELRQEVLSNDTVQQILYTLATVLGVIVGVTLWCYKRIAQWYNNGGKDSFYFGINTRAGKDDEQFGIGVFKLYVGLYNNVLHIGFTDHNGCLPWMTLNRRWVRYT